VIFKFWFKTLFFNPNGQMLIEKLMLDKASKGKRPSTAIITG